MGRHLLMGIAAAVIIAGAFALLRPPQNAPKRALDLPWQIHVDADGNSKVFGLVLARSTLLDAERVFQQEGELTLFEGPTGQISVEAYFNRVSLSGIGAKVVLALEPGPEAKREMLGRGLRVSTLGSGTRKVTLHPEDAAWLKQVPVHAITYIPTADLDEALIGQRFGQPERKVAEPAGVVHWLYPHFGLDIAVNPEGKEVFQYVSPQSFEELAAPLDTSSRPM